MDEDEKPTGLRDSLTRDFARLTRAEKSIANVMLINSGVPAFETAAAIAGKVGVSQMTVGRILRTQGYRGAGLHGYRTAVAPGFVAFLG